MARSKVRLNSAGVSEILKSLPMQAAIKVKAEQVKRLVDAQNIRVGDKDGGPREVDLPVEIEAAVSDRARASVTLAHPAGQSAQAKHGALTKAAAQAGLDVKGAK